MDFTSINSSIERVGYTSKVAVRNGVAHYTIKDGKQTVFQADMSLTELAKNLMDNSFCEAVSRHVGGSVLMREVRVEMEVESDLKLFLSRFYGQYQASLRTNGGPMNPYYPIYPQLIPETKADGEALTGIGDGSFKYDMDRWVQEVFYQDMNAMAHGDWVHFFHEDDQIRYAITRKVKTGFLAAIRMHDKNWFEWGKMISDHILQHCTQLPKYGIFLGIAQGILGAWKGTIDCDVNGVRAKKGYPPHVALVRSLCRTSCLW